jgi:hypothetical protein
MSKGWFFGDSFTAGVNANKYEKYYEWAGGGKTFSKLLCEDYNVEEVNKGLPGKCNNSVINSIVENLQYIKSGDLVVISNTSPIRDLVPVTQKYKQLDDFKIGLTSQKLYNSSEHKESIGYKDKDVNFALTEYALKARAPYIPEWNAYYRNIFINFTKYFLSIGCNAIFWDYSVWSEEEAIGTAFETIVAATNNEIFDLHWSFKGHGDAYRWIKDGLDKNTIFLQYPLGKKNKELSWLLD